MATVTIEKYGSLAVSFSISETLIDIMKKLNAMLVTSEC